MLVYLFRDENSRDTFAYSTDVTGRSITRTSPHAKWNFVAATRFEDLDDNEEATRHLRQYGLYVFPKATLKSHSILALALRQNWVVQQ